MFKKGQVSLNKKIEAGAILIIIVIVLFQLYAGLVPEAQKAGEKMNVSNRCAAVGCIYNATTASESGLEQDCANNLSAERQVCPNSLGKGIPLSGLFASSGIVFLLIIVGLLLVILKTVLPPKGKK